MEVLICSDDPHELIVKALDLSVSLEEQLCTVLIHVRCIILRTKHL